MSSRWPARLLFIGEMSPATEELVCLLERVDCVQTRWAHTAGDAIDLSTGYFFDAILINDRVEALPGYELCALLRRHHVGAPIILLSDKCSDPDEILALQSGATDYVGPTVTPNVVVARIRSQIRHYRFSGRAKYPIGQLVLDATNKVLTDPEAGTELVLTKSEAALLKYLCLAESRIVPFEELKTEVWHYDSASKTHTVSTHISKLKRKISKELGYRHILVGTRIGYRIGSGEKSRGSEIDQDIP